MIRGLLVLLVFLLAGEGLGRLAGLPVPGSVLGMALLAAALRAGALPLATVKPAADGVVRVLPLFFVPAGVGVARYGALLRAQWLAISASAVLSTLAVLATVGWIQQRGERGR